MGQMLLYDLYYSKTQQEPFNLFNLDDVDKVFYQIITLKYKQKYKIESKA